MKKIIAVFLSVLLLLSLAACSKDAIYGSVSDNAVEAPNRAAEGKDVSVYHRNSGSGSTAPSGTDNETISQKLIRKISITIETEDYEAFLEGITEKAAALGGYIEEIEASTSGKYPSATLTVRVPAAELDAFTERVAGSGNITYQHESQQDVTLQYVDTESHITALRAEQDRLLALLDQAGSLTEVLEIEDRLTQVRYQLESYERSLRALANQVDYATVTIDLTQVKTYSPTEEVGFWENIRIRLKENLGSLWELLKSIFSFLIIWFPYLLLFLVLPVILLVVLIKRSSRKAKNRAKSAPGAAANRAANYAAQGGQPRPNGPAQTRQEPRKPAEENTSKEAE